MSYPWCGCKPKCPGLAVTTQQETEIVMSSIRANVAAALAKVPAAPGGDEKLLGERKAIAAGVHLLCVHSAYNDGDSLRNITTLTRFYSPVGTGVSVDLSFEWHNRPRWSSTEEYSHVHYKVRRLCEAQPLEPHGFHPYIGLSDSGRLLGKDQKWKDPKLVKKGELLALRRTLFGEAERGKAKKSGALAARLRSMSAPQCTLLFATASGAMSYMRSSVWSEARWLYRAIDERITEDEDGDCGPRLAVKDGLMYPFTLCTKKY